MSGTPERREFQAEVTQLLDIVIHSLYSNKDIFLRELISNASDAMDRLRFEGLTRPELLTEDELYVRIERDKERRTLTIVDNGIGMSREEVERNIGTIAQSGTAEFLKAALEGRDNKLAPELIGQFGVGFYSSFMVADRVTLSTRRAGEDTGTVWESAGQGWFTINEGERETFGTTVTIHLKPVDSDHGIKDYTDEWVIKDIVKRYSDFVAYPIRMKGDATGAVRDAEGKPAESKAPDDDQTLNSMKAIWTRPQGEVTEEEYTEFYHHITHDWNAPLLHIASRMEGGVEARALMYVPSQAPPDMYYREMSYRGLQLYVKRVFILDECRDLMPQHLRFIKGVVDAEDISLNVSRELLQQDRQVTAIRKFLVRRIMDELKKLKAAEATKYQQFWTQFGPVVKEGLLGPEDKREAILDLVLTPSSTTDETTDLAGYVGRMKEGQDAIYYLTGPSVDVVEQSPLLEAFRAQGYEVLFFTDPVDEVWLEQAPAYQEHGWTSISRGALDLGSDEEQKAAEVALREQGAKHESLLGALQKSLEDHVKEIRLSSRLTSSASCLVGDAQDLSPQIAEMLRRAGQEIPPTKRVLELNPSHPILTKLQERFDADKSDPVVGEYANLLYGQAVLAEGGQLDDPAEFGKQVAELMVRGL